MPHVVNVADSPEYIGREGYSVALCYVYDLYFLYLALKIHGVAYKYGFDETVGCFPSASENIMLFTRQIVIFVWTTLTTDMEQMSELDFRWRCSWL